VCGETVGAIMFKMSCHAFVLEQYGVER